MKKTRKLGIKDKSLLPKAQKSKSPSFKKGGLTDPFMSRMPKKGRGPKAISTGRFKKSLS